MRSPATSRSTTCCGKETIARRRNVGPKQPPIPGEGVATCRRGRREDCRGNWRRAAGYDVRLARRRARSSCRCTPLGVLVPFGRGRLAGTGGADVVQVGAGLQGRMIRCSGNPHSGLRKRMSASVMWELLNAAKRCMDSMCPPTQGADPARFVATRATRYQTLLMRSPVRPREFGIDRGPFRGQSGANLREAAATGTRVRSVRPAVRPHRSGRRIPALRMRASMVGESIPQPGLRSVTVGGRLPRRRDQCSALLRSVRAAVWLVDVYLLVVALGRSQRSASRLTKSTRSRA